MTGQILPYSETVFAGFNLWPTLLIVAVMPFVLILIRPRDSEAQLYAPPIDEPTPLPTGDLPFARRVEQSRWGSLFLVAGGVGWFVVQARGPGTTMDINTVIFLFLIAGMLLHGAPVNYANAVKSAARQTGAIMLPTTMAVAMGEQVANMLQPFWALPVVAIAGIGIQRVLGFTVVTFLVTATIYAAAL